jgi:hypothetical protein
LRVCKIPLVGMQQCPHITENLTDFPDLPFARRRCWMVSS